MSKIANKDILKFNSLVNKLKFMDAKVLEEAEVKISEMVIGGTVELIDAEGNLTIAENGDYEVNGSKFTVEAGVITFIYEDFEEVEVTADEVVVEEVAVEDLKTEIETLKEDIESLVEIVEEGFKLMNKFVSALNQPTVATVTATSDAKFSRVKDTLSKLTGK